MIHARLRITSINAEVVPLQNVQGNVTGKTLLDSPKARRIPDACAALGVSRSTIYKLEAQGKIKLVRIAGRTVVPESEIDRLARQGA